MCTLVEELSNSCDYFLKLSRFPDFFGKVFLITFKGATKSYFKHYSSVVIVLFNMGLSRSTFSTSFLSLCAFCVFVLNQMFRIKTLKYVLSCYVILLCNLVMQFCSHFITTRVVKTIYKNSIV